VTSEEVRVFIHEQCKENLTTTNDHSINLEQSLVPPQRITIITRRIKDGRAIDEKLSVWLVGQESSADGYRIIMRDDGSQFGLVSSGFAHDECPVLVGWYGDLRTTFLSM